MGLRNCKPKPNDSLSYWGEIFSKGEALSIHFIKNVFVIHTARLCPVLTMKMGNLVLKEQVQKYNICYFINISSTALIYF